MSDAQYLRCPPPLTSLFSPTPTFPRGLVDQVIAPVCVVVATAVVAIAVVTIVTAVTVVILIIAVGGVGESFLAPCDEFIILINALVMWLSCPGTKCSDKPCRRLGSACEQVKWQRVHIGSVLCSPLASLDELDLDWSVDWGMAKLDWRGSCPSCACATSIAICLIFLTVLRHPH